VHVFQPHQSQVRAHTVHPLSIPRGATLAAPQGRTVGGFGTIPSVRLGPARLST
jgi:hypothetical protein